MKKSSNTLTISIIILFLFVSAVSFAQDKNDDLEKKAEQLNGKVEKITVQVDGKDVVFEGKEAQQLAKGLKLFAHHPNLMWFSDDKDIDSKGEKKMVFKMDGGKFNWNSAGNDKKKIEIKIDDGNKKVSVTTNKNGKEETKVYEGEDAEKYLKEHEREGDVEFFTDDDDSSGDVIIFKDKDDDECCCCGKHMKIRRMKGHDKGMKKIIIEKEEKNSEKK